MACGLFITNQKISHWLSFIGFSILYRKVSVVLPKQFFTAAFSKNATPEP